MKPSARPAAVSSYPAAPTAPEPPRKPTTVPAAAAKFGLVVIAGATKGQKFRLTLPTVQVGRSKGAIIFSEDRYLSPIHATFVVKDGGVTVKDEASVSGVFVAISGVEPLQPSGYFSAGRRLFRFTGSVNAARPPAAGPIVYGAPNPTGQTHYGVEEILIGGRPGRAVIHSGTLLTIGQTSCDLAFPGDEGMAPRHCELSPTPTGAMLRDLSGGIGTFLKVSGERLLKSGDRVRLGEHVLQLESI
jgi:pSer/pThr/pTyr-binding forkhead associated (FHA) protein